jgi:hypothetical protein
VWIACYDYLVKRTALKRRTTKQKKARVLKEKYTPPEWFMAVKPGAHGNSPAQKRLWRIVSEAVRKEDYERFGGRCVSCPRVLDTWQDGQCAHYKPWSVCNGLFKYERRNLALSCSFCNQNSGADIGHRFGEEMKRRYGTSILDWIEEENQRHRGEKLDILQIVGLAELWKKRYG